MTFREKLRRYFVGNTAPVVEINWIGGTRKYIPWRCANSRGFYWLGFQVGWRIPYFEGFAYNPEHRRWEIPLSRRADGESLQ